MDCDNLPTLSEAHPETMDFLSRAWCDFAVKEALQPEFQNQALVLHDYAISSFDDGSMSPDFKVHASDTNTTTFDYFVTILRNKFAEIGEHKDG